VFVVLAAAAFLTAFYMARQLVLVFFGEARTEAAQKATESSRIMTVPLVILAVLSVAGGALNLPGLHTLEHWLAYTLGEGEPAHFVWLVAGISLGLALLGLGLGWLVYSKKPSSPYVDPLKKALGPLFTGMEKKWLVDELYETVILNPYKAFAGFMAEPVDLGLIDRIGGGLAAGTRALAEGLRSAETGYIRSYGLWMLLGLAAILTWLILR